MPHVQILKLQCNHVNRYHLISSLTLELDVKCLIFRQDTTNLHTKFDQTFVLKTTGFEKGHSK